MSIWEDVQVVDHEGKKHNASEVFADKVVALYFSAGWCPSCRSFTPKLKRCYEALKGTNKNFEIVFVSRDHEAEDLIEYFNDHHGKWYYLEFGHPLIHDLYNKYEIETIPVLKIIEDDGSVIVENACTDVRDYDDSEELFGKWTQKPSSTVCISNPFHFSSSPAQEILPTMFKTPVSKPKTPTSFQWSVQHKAILMPDPLDESFYYESPDNPEQRERIQKKLDEFWNQPFINPSPEIERIIRQPKKLSLENLDDHDEKEN